MAITEHERLAFKDFERAGWGKQAGHYDSFIGQTTQQAVDRLLDAVSTRRGTTLLDVASGPGYVAAAATLRGAHATGIDISQEMVSEARSRFVGTNFDVRTALGRAAEALSLTAHGECAIGGCRLRAHKGSAPETEYGSDDASKFGGEPGGV